MIPLIICKRFAGRDNTWLAVFVCKYHILSKCGFTAKQIFV